jgi:glycosyltransferase involved in cell wall biosynthesis
MKVLHIITSISRGGAENHLLDLIQFQVANRWEVMVAFLKGDGYWKLRLEEIGVVVVCLEMKTSLDVFPVFRLIRLLKKTTPDIIHAHLGRAEIVAWLALQCFEKSFSSLIISKHNDEGYQKIPFQRQIERLIGKSSSHVICISEAVKGYFQRRWDDNSLPMSVVHYGINANYFSSARFEDVENLRTSLNIPKGVLVFGIIARLVKQKGIDYLLESYRSYLDEASQATKLIIVGAGPDDEKIREQIERLKVSKNVILAGFREDINIVMQVFDVFVLSSRFEGFGLVLLEAMASKRPIIATRVSAIPEVVEDNVSGILVPFGDQGKMKDAFLAMEDESTRKKFGANGEERAKNVFSNESMFLKINMIYNKVIQDKSS